MEGVITAIRGSVVDVAFPAGLPPLYSRLAAGPGGKAVLEVEEHLDRWF